MSEYYVLYNPLAGSVKQETVEAEIKKALEGEELKFYDVTKINYTEMLGSAAKEIKILVAGGDGTLNRFINECGSLLDGREIYYYAAGNGNDFWTDLGRKKGDAPVCINEYLKNLPTVTVKGKTYKFINGVGYGIDGYCCETGDRLKAAGKKVNYTGIAVKGLLFHYKPANAEVTVDGVTKKYKKAWIAPTMKGRYYGGGMIPTPEQDRLDDKKRVSVCMFYGKGKIKTLMVFPSIFKGQHVKKTKMVDILCGNTVTVKFDKPRALQIDGETVVDVSEYTVTTVNK